MWQFVGSLTVQQKIEILEPFFGAFLRSSLIKHTLPPAAGGEVVQEFMISLGIVGLQFADKYPNLDIALTRPMLSPFWERAPAWLDLMVFFRDIHRTPNWPISMNVEDVVPEEKSKRLIELFSGRKACVHAHFGGQSSYSRSTLVRVLENLREFRPDVLFSIGPELNKKEGDEVGHNQELVDLFLAYASLPADQRGRVVGVLLPFRQEYHPWTRVYVDDMSKNTVFDMRVEMLHVGGQKVRSQMCISNPLAAIMSLGLTARFLVEDEGGEVVCF